MTKQKTTKRALLLSALALLSCVTMLIGSTFAWFTDSVTSAGNKIQAGTLDVQLLMDLGDVNGYTDISNSAKPIFGADSLLNEQDWWEPGKTEVAYLAIKNNGSLALKYKVALAVTNVTKSMTDVMEYAIIPDATKTSAPVTAWNGGDTVSVGEQTVTADYVSLGAGATHYFALAIHMNEEAGNEYQGGTCGFDMTVLAVQDTVEADSFGTTYDEDATRESNITVDTPNELNDALADTRDGDVITLGANLELTETLVYDGGDDITLDLGGHTLQATPNTLSRSTSDVATLIKVTSGTLVLQNGNIKNVKDNATDTLVGIHLSGDAVAEIKDINIEVTGNGILLTDNAKITELNANILTYANANGFCDASSICLYGGRIDAITGGEYVSTYSKEFIDAYTGSFSGIAIYPIMLNDASASIGEISGGTFLGRTDDGSNGAILCVNAGKIEKISGGYFGFCKYSLRNSPYYIITVNTANGASIDAITGGSFEYASGFGCDFNNIVDQSGSKVVERNEKVTVSVKYSTSVRTYDVAILDVIAK